MKGAGVLIGMFFILLAPKAHSEIPDYVLDRDYQNCVNNDPDPHRAIYCACIREGMRGWDQETYMEVATQEAATSGSQGPLPGRIEDLAKQCMAKALQ